MTITQRPDYQRLAQTFAANAPELAHPIARTPSGIDAACTAFVCWGTTPDLIDARLSALLVSELRMIRAEDAADFRAQCADLGIDPAHPALAA